MHGEGPFHAHAVGDAADGEGLTDAAVLLGDDDAFVGLQPLAVALHDFDEDFDLVADGDLGQIRSHAFLLNVHIGLTESGTSESRVLSYHIFNL